MKILYLILPVLMLACSSSKELKPPKEKNSNPEEAIEIKMEDNYICNIEVINNRMPSTDTEKFMYAIVTLLPESGQLKDNWKISSFEIDGTNYSTFDEPEFTGKDLLIYRNNVRKISKDTKNPFSAKVVFENETGLSLTYELKLLEVFDVH